MTASTKGGVAKNTYAERVDVDCDAEADVDVEPVADATGDIASSVYEGCLVWSAATLMAPIITALHLGVMGHARQTCRKST